jgi:hypothetical protein
MRPRRFALTWALLLGTATMALTVWIATLPRVRSDVIQVTLERDGRPMKSVPVMLASDSPGNSHCQSEGLRGFTDARGNAQWERALPDQNFMGFGRQTDKIVICAKIDGQQVVLWRRVHLQSSERMNVSCDAAGYPAFRCVVEYDVTLGQTAYFTVIALLVAMLVRVFWYRKSEAASLMALAFLLVGVLGLSLLLAISMRQFTQLLLMTGMVGGLAGLHVALTRFFRQSEEPGWAPEFRNSGSPKP